MYNLCRNREDLCSCFWMYFLCFSKCVAASTNISMFFKKRAAASERYHWTTTSERKWVADIFYVCGCFWKHFNVFNERAAASEKILTTASEIYLFKEKMCDCFLELYPHRKLFWSEKQIKIKTRWEHILHFRSPLLLRASGWITVIKIISKESQLPWKTDHLFNMVSEIIEADGLHLILLSDGTRIGDNEYCMEEQIQNCWSILNWKDF